MDLKMEFVLKSLQPGANIRALCREMNISPKTGYKWQQRFLAEGKVGLCDATRRPQRSPTRVPEAVVCELVRLKQCHRRWGPRKIRELYLRLHGTPPSISTCKRILLKAGLVEPRRPRAQRDTGRLAIGTVALAPNDVWTVDFKGWWKVAGGQRCEPLTVRDAYSRYVLAAQPLNSTRTEVVRLAFERLFTIHGLPATIRSDNGSPFAASHALLGLSRLSTWWLALGINVERIEPGKPQQNGGHERMHRDLCDEVQAVAAGDLGQQEAALEIWRRSFNRERPHEALHMKTPAEIFCKSSRRYEGTPNEIVYDMSHLTRRVNQRGDIMIYGSRLFLSESLCGWDVGLKPDGIDFFEVWFAHLLLGRIDLTTISFLTAPSRRQERDSRSTTHPVTQQPN
jgi:transposase InsO family protein